MLQLIAAWYACIESHEFFPEGSDTREAPQTWHFMLGPNVLVLALLRLLLHDAKPTPPSFATAPCDACCLAEPRVRNAAAKGGKMRHMNQGFGIEIPGDHLPNPHREPARYLVVIDSGGSTNAMLFLASRKLIAEFDAGTEEATQMTRGLTSTQGATGPEWDAALQGHGEGERRAARVFTLDV